MFSAVNHFQMFKPGRFKQENQSKASEQHQTLLNDHDWKWQKTLCA